MTKAKKQFDIEHNQNLPEDLIGERIKSKRLSLDLNFEQLSRLSKDYDSANEGISPTSLLRYESGKFKPGARELRILCDTLDVSANWLLLGEGDSARHVPLSFDEGMECLKKAVEDSLYKQNPFRRRGMDAVRTEKILHAKKP